MYPQIVNPRHSSINIKLYIFKHKYLIPISSSRTQPPFLYYKSKTQLCHPTHQFTNIETQILHINTTTGYGPYRRGEANADGTALHFPINTSLNGGDVAAGPSERKISSFNLKHYIIAIKL